MDDNYPLDIFNTIVDFCEKNHITHEDDYKHGQVVVDIDLHDCLISSVTIIFRVSSMLTTGIVVYGILPPTVNEEHRSAIAEYISRINYMIRQGNFEIDFNDGEVRYKLWIDCDEKLPAFKTIAQCIAIVKYSFECYGDGLVKIMLGQITAEKAVSEVKGCWIF